MEILTGVAVTAVIVLVYLGTYLLNKNTTSPIDDDIGDEETCGTCANYSCGLKQRYSEEA